HRYHLLERTKRLKGFPVDRGVDLDYGHRFSAPLAAAQMKVADVDPMIAQDGSDATNDPGYVAVLHQKHVPARRGFDVKAVDLGDAALALAAGNSKNRAGHCSLAVPGNHPRANRRNKIAARAHVSSRHRDAAFLRNDEGINRVNARAHVA